MRYRCLSVKLSGYIAWTLLASFKYEPKLNWSALVGLFLIEKEK